MTITNGSFLMGENGDYADLDAALADIDSGGLTADMKLIQVSPYTIVGSGATRSIKLNGHELMITSAIDPKGKPAVAFETTVADTLAVLPSISIELPNTDVGKLRIERQYWKRTNGSSNANDILKIFPDFADRQAHVVEIEDCSFNGNDRPNCRGVEVFSDLDFKIWNCVFMGFSDSGVTAWGLRLGNGLNTQARLVDNCIFSGNFHGCRIQDRWILTNCIAHDNSSEDFFELNAHTPSRLASSGNISSDSTASMFTGPFNQAGLADLVEQFVSTLPANKDFYVPVDGSFLFTAGAPPQVDLNTTSVEGNARPGSNNGIASGLCQRREVLREHWSSQRKITIDGEKIGVSSSELQLCITHKAPGMDDVLKSAKADGGDIRITTDRWGWEQLPVEVAQWDVDAGECMVWFKPGAVVAGEDYSCYVWFGNERASHLPLSHDLGQWNVWADYTFVAHCMEDPINDGWVKDSSPGKHYGVFVDELSTTWQDGLPDGGAVGKSYQFKAAAETTHILLPAGDYVNSKTSVQLAAWGRPISTSAGVILNMSDNAATNNRLSIKNDSGRKLGSAAYIPDVTTFVSGQDSNVLPDATPTYLGAAYKLDSAPEKIRFFQDGAFSEEDDISSAVPPFSATDSTIVTMGCMFLIQTYYPGRLQEVWLHVGDRVDEFQETFYENLENGDAFFKTPSLVNQKGDRNIDFVTDEGEVHLDATDYFISYEKGAAGDLVMTLNAVWEAVGLDQPWGMPRRRSIEQRLRELAGMVEKFGTLTIGPDYPQAFGKMTLTGVDVSVNDNNTAIIYALTFDPGGVYKLSRSLVFNGKRVDARDFLVEYSAQDRTVFKEVFRAAPMRIQSGPSLTMIAITSMIAIVGDGETALEARKKQEEFLKEWAVTRLGSEGTLEVDGEDLGTAHLATVTPAEIDLPGRVGVRMEFATGYGS